MKRPESALAEAASTAWLAWREPDRPRSQQGEAWGDSSEFMRAAAAASGDAGALRTFSVAEAGQAPLGAPCLEQPAGQQFNQAPQGAAWIRVGARRKLNPVPLLAELGWTAGASVLSREAGWRS